MFKLLELLKMSNRQRIEKETLHFNISSNTLHVMLGWFRKKPTDKAAAHYYSISPGF